MRALLFGGVKANSWLFDVGLLPIRVFAGLALAIEHGLQKVPPTAQFVESVGALGFPVPIVFAIAAACSEVGGGFLLALGLFTRPAAFFIVCTMMVAAFLQHAGEPFTNKERAFLFGGIAFLFLCLGAGRFSADARIVRR
jgi:putative oxidoreductase